MDTTNWEPSLDVSVEATVLDLVETHGEIEIAALFRALVGRFGAHAVPYIAPAISRALDTGEIKMDARLASTHGSTISILLATRVCRPHTV